MSKVGHHRAHTNNSPFQKNFLTLFFSPEYFASTHRKPLAAAGYCSDLLHKPSPLAPPNMQLFFYTRRTRNNAIVAFQNEVQPIMERRWQQIHDTGQLQTTEDNSLKVTCTELSNVHFPLLTLKSNGHMSKPLCYKFM